MSRFLRVAKPIAVVAGVWALGWGLVGFPLAVILALASGLPLQVFIVSVITVTIGFGILGFTAGAIFSIALSELAALLNSTPHKLSEILNSRIGVSFYDFVNGYRVREVQRRIKAGEARTQKMLALALDAGFASKSTFNEAFKKAHASDAIRFPRDRRSMTFGARAMTSGRRIRPCERPGRSRDTQRGVV